MFAVLLVLAVVNLAGAIEAMTSTPTKDLWIVLHSVGALVASLGARQALEDREGYQ